MTPRTKEQNEEIRLRRLTQIRKAAADVFLNKGPLLEIRDVAAQAGLGYGTVYHYYSNKGDLLYDLLWDAVERAGGWLEAPLEFLLEAPLEARLKVPLEAQLKAPRASASGRRRRAGISPWLRRRTLGTRLLRIPEAEAAERPLPQSLAPSLPPASGCCSFGQRTTPCTCCISRPVRTLPRCLKRARPCSRPPFAGRCSRRLPRCWKPGVRRTGLTLPAETRRSRRIGYSMPKCCWLPWSAAPRFRFAAESCTRRLGISPCF